VDDTHIRQLTEEVLQALRSGAATSPGDLEARVAALERSVRELSRGVSSGAAVPTLAAVAVAAPAAPAHPSFRLLDVGGGSAQCVLEPDKPCVQSGQCRRLGH
jgi:hypothetical protein